ncbi:MAG TPA: hypothetical protein VHD60_01585 [Candidatus Saccharimonadales bacterium]|nr:hypothetical protein [Candidatus Saccharimonadales bacterium]
MDKNKNTPGEYKPMLYHDKPPRTEKQRKQRSIGKIATRTILAGAVTAGLATSLKAAGDMQRHHVANEYSGRVASSALPSIPEQSLPPLPTGPEAIPESPDLKVILAPALRDYAARIVDLTTHNVGEHTFFVSNNSISLTESVKVDDVATHSQGSYTFVVTGKPNAQGDNVDPNQVSEIQLEAQSGATPLFSASFTEVPGSDDWVIAENFVTDSAPVTFNLSTDPNAVGKEVLTTDTLNVVLASANQFIENVTAGVPVGKMPVPNFQSEPVPPPFDPGLQV